MKYILNESGSYDVMVQFLKKNYPELTVPLIKEKITGKGNSGWGSSMNDYTYLNLYYKDENGEIWFRHFDDRCNWNNSKWEVNDRLEYMYDFFGEKLFEKFIKEYFGFDIAKKGNKDYNWLFT